MLCFQTPPNWPDPPQGWVPPAGWQPDPSWGPAPPGWRFWRDSSAQPTTGQGPDEQVISNPAASLRAQVVAAAKNSGQRVRELLHDERVTTAAAHVKRLSKDERTQKAAAVVAVAGVGIAAAVLKQTAHPYLGHALELGSQELSARPAPSIDRPNAPVEPPTRVGSTSTTGSMTPNQTFESMQNVMNTLHTAQTGMLQNFTTPFDEWQRRR